MTDIETAPHSLPRLAITTGEAAGIGPDITLAVAQQDFDAELVVIADKTMLGERARQLAIDITLQNYIPGQARQSHTGGTLKVLHVPLAKQVKAGQAVAANGPAILKTLRLATNGCLDGNFSALVTGPVNKAVINNSGTPFSGHTEYLAKLTATAQVVMMLATPGLRVALVTTHLPLRQVADALTPQWLRNTLHITYHELQRHFGIACPRLLVCGLNPHAGEEGHLGHEDAEIIAPAIAEMQAAGCSVHGPFAADTVFTPHHMANADAIIAIYHDQGLPVLKHMGFGQAVNITLGLPIIRTSVDHGTAFDLAGTGQADCGSMLAAIDEAIKMVRAADLMSSTNLQHTTAQP